MTRPLRFSKAEIANAAVIAREHGVVVKLERDGSMLVIPETHKPATVDTAEDVDLDAELQRWKAQHGYD